MKRILLLFTMLMVIAAQSFAQQRTISGKVTGNDGNPIPFATIQVQGTNTGTTSDENGNFSLSVPGNATLVVRSIGYEPQEIAIGSQSSYNIQLASSTKSLNELVVTALGRTENKSKVGYSTTTFDASQISANAPISVLDNLAGQVAGADISTLGGPGSSTKVVLRGYGVISGGSNQPLYVIDGVPLADNRPGAIDGNVDFGNGISNINPNDIASVTVLKGTAATALYGSSARNGAIMITTKRGSEGKLKIEYSGSANFSRVGRLPKLQNQFGNGWGDEFILSENGSWGPRLDGVMRPWGSIVDNSQLVKPYSAIDNNIRNFYTTGVEVTNNLAISGGSEHNRFYFSYGNVSSNGVIPTKTDYLQRNNFSLRTNSNYGKFSINTSFNYINRKMNAPNTGQASSSGGGVFESLLQIPVDIPIEDFQLYQNKFFNVDNYFTPYAENPYYGLYENGDQQSSDRFFGNLDLKYQFTNEFSAQIRMGGDFENSRTLSWNQPNAPQPGSWNGPNPTNPEGQSRKVDPGSVEKLSQYYGTINTDFILQYTKALNDFNLDVMAGANYYQNTYDRTDASITNLVIPGFFNLSNSEQPPVATENKSRRRRIGLYGQAVLGYKDQLYLTGNVRNDWSSTLPIDNNSIFYPGASLSWVVSNTFGMTNNTVSYLKLRAAYGITGADPDPYQTYSVLTPADISLGFGSLTSPFNGVSAFGVSNTINNNKLKPIMTREFEAGAEISFLGDRIGIDATYYHKISDGQIFPVSVDPSSGYTSLVENLGKVRNQGVELSLHVVPVKTNNFEWSFTYNFAKNQNKVINLNGGLPNPLLLSVYDAELRAVVGKTVAEIYAPTPQLSPSGQIVVSAETGFPLVNQTPDTSDNNMTKRRYGSALYDYTMGISNTFRYKNFTLDAALDFRYGGVMYSGTADLLNFVGNAYNTTYNDRRPFIIPNSVIESGVDGNGKPVYVENTIPIPVDDYYDYYYMTKNPAMAYDARIFDRSFLKLRSVNLSYTLPEQWSSKIGSNNLSIGIYAKNILLWTPASNYMVDPEATNEGNDIEGELGEFRTSPLEEQFGFSLRATF